MFRRTRKSTERPSSARQQSEQFLRAQEERLRNRYDVYGDPVQRGLAEVVLRPSPNHSVRNVNNKSTEVESALRNVIHRLYADFVQAYATDTHLSDPFSDGRIMEDEDYNQLMPADQEIAQEFYRYLEAELRGEHKNSENKIL